MRDTLTSKLARMALPGVLLALAGAAQADSPAQVRQAIQAACDRNASAYVHADLAGVMAKYAQGYRVTDIMGRSTNYAQQKAALARIFKEAGRTTTARYSVGAVTLSGGQAHAIIQSHFLTHHARSARLRAYTLKRDYSEQTVWVKSAGGWQEISAQFLQDTMTYQK